MPHRPHAPLLALMLALPLAACGSGDGNGTHISIRSEGGDGNATVDAQENGQVAFSVPGFSGSVKLPKISVNAENFDVNGVHLYPDSRILGMDIGAHDAPGKDGGKDKGTVTVRFASPAAADKVRDWFAGQMRAHHFQVIPSTGGLSGTTDEGDPFTLTIAPAGSGKANGTLTVNG